MKITGFKYVPFNRKFLTPFSNSLATFKTRSGFYLFLEDEAGNHSIGECSPLPGFSSETINEAQLLFDTMGQYLIGKEIPTGKDSFIEILAPYKSTPSVKFAIEQAFINLSFAQKSSYLWREWGANKPVLNVNAVFGFDEPASLLEKMEHKFASGFRTFKIKIGRKEFGDDFSILEHIYQKYGNSIKIRVDVNRKWGFEESKRNLDRLSRFDIEFIEEPCSRFDDLIEVAKNSPVPIAADESVRSHESFIRINNESKINFIIIKPMIYGGIFDSARFIQLAEEQHKKVIISSAFESYIGKSALVLLATLAKHSFAHGLDTAGFFENDLHDPFKISNGTISIDKDIFPINIDADKLCY